MSIKSELDLEEMVKKVSNLKGLGLGDEDVMKLLGIEEEDYEEIMKKYRK